MLGLQIFLADWDIELFAIDWLKRGILVERETSVLTISAEAIAAR
jgi:hypothetical protein